MVEASDKLRGRKILLCVCGGIAAYKAAELVRRLRDAGATVQVAMTEGALHFVGTPTFQAVSGRSEEHTSELQSLMRISYAVFCLKKTKKQLYTEKLYDH